jgi:hypothetical protein
MPYNFFFKRSCAVLLAFFLAKSVCAQLYTNVSQSAQLNTLFGSAANFGGVSAVDFNKDGFEDLTLCIDNTARFLKNNGDNTFSDVPLMSVSGMYLSALQWIDFDNDGDYDFWCTQQYGPWFLMRNDGNGQFVNVVESAGLSLPYYGIQYGSTWGDYDRDGLLDLYICLYHEEPMPGVEQALIENKLYRNLGNGTFSNVSLSSGTSDGLRLSLQATFFDYNRDLWPDIYIANDKAGANSLYRNNGNGTFTNVASSTNSAIAPLESMSTTIDDINNDGLEDIFISGTNFQVNQLLRNNQGTGFQNITLTSGMPNMIQSWHGSFEDFNNDGFRDLMMCQSIYPSAKAATMYLQNNGNSTFSHNIATSGLSQPGVVNMTGVPIDFNNNGALDFFVPNTYPVSFTLWRNNMSVSNWVKFQLQGVISNRDGIGSWVDIWTGGVRRSLMTHCGEGFLSQNSFTEHVGIGQNTTVDSLIVSWPSGWQDKYFNLNSNQKYMFYEGETFQVSLSENVLYQCADSVFEVSTLDNPTYSYAWNTGDTLANVQISEPGIYHVRVTHPLGFHAFSDTLTVVDNRNSGVYFQVTPPLCHGDATGFISTYNNASASYIWLDEESYEVPSGLASGYYPLSIVYGATCIKDTIIFIPDALPYSPAISSSNALCFGSTDGTIISDLHASETIAFSLNGTPMELPHVSVGAGSYFVELTSINGCRFDSLIVVSEPLPLSLIVQDTTVACFGESVIPSPPSIQGGMGNYTIWWTNEQNQEQEGEFGELEEGEYTVFVQDENGCLASQEFEVESPDQLAASLQFSYQENGIVYTIADAQGGALPYTINWTFEGATFEGPTFQAEHCGALVWTLSDANGCTISGNMDCTSVQEEDSELLVFPNPARRELNIHSPIAGTAQLRIFDVAGRLVKEANMSNTNFILLIDELSEGLYSLQFIQNSNAIVVQFVKQN